MKNKSNLHHSILRICLILLGNIIYALAVKFFLIPGNLITGGSTGIALAVNHLCGLNVSFFVLLFNIIMLIIGFFLLGGPFALTTILSTFTYPFALGLLDRLFPDVIITQDIILCTIFSGLGIGLAVGIVIRAGASTGGMDVPPLILNRIFKIPVSVSLYFFDVCILLAQALFTDFEKILYGIILVFIYTMVIDKLMILGASQTEIKIVSTRSRQIKNAILHELDRGVTLLDGHGGYSEQPTELILTVISNRELPKIEHLVQSIDPECFMVVSRVSEVGGRGFSLKKKYLP